MGVNVHRADIDVPDDSPWAILPCEWEDGEDNHLGFGPIVGMIDDAHKIAARLIPCQDYTLVRLVKP